MQRFYHVLSAGVMFLVLILLGDLLQFLPPEKMSVLLGSYCVLITLISLFVDYSGKKTVELTDFLVSFAILFILYLYLQQSFDLQQWFFLAFAILSSTITFGCNRRFKNMIQAAQSQ